jgi:hypothetical protein
VRPAITAAEVARMRSSGGVSARVLRTLTTGLESLRIVFQAIVRIR